MTEADQIATILGGILAVLALLRIAWHAVSWGRAVLGALVDVVVEVKKISGVITNHENRIRALERRRGA